MLRMMRTSILRNLFPPQPHLRLTSLSGDEAALWLSGTMPICVVEWHFFKTRSEQFKARSIRFGASRCQDARIADGTAIPVSAAHWLAKHPGIERVHYPARHVAISSRPFG
jgi:hypothetical protein